MLFTGREVRLGKNCARGLEYVLKTKGTVFSHTDRLSPVNNMFIFFSCSKLALQITNGFVYATLVIQWASAPSTNDL